MSNTTLALALRAIALDTGVLCTCGGGNHGERRGDRGDEVVRVWQDMAASGRCQDYLPSMVAALLRRGVTEPLLALLRDEVEGSPSLYYELALTHVVAGDMAAAATAAQQLVDRWINEEDETLLASQIWGSGNGAPWVALAVLTRDAAHETLPLIPVVWRTVISGATALDNDSDDARLGVEQNAHLRFQVDLAASVVTCEAVTAVPPLPRTALRLANGHLAVPAPA